ncbi:carbohydrate-binding domain-containing protein [Candidatus Saccharibacteria bacterium]|nr:carbohydrate-binding domain-containing protein [Candidatus Saccharibacteria bacterium]
MSSYDSAPNDSAEPTPSPASPRRFDKKWLIAGIIVALIIAIGIVANLISTDNSATKVTGLVDVDNGDLKINWARYTEANITLSDSLTITDSGIYHLTGTLSDGAITIDSGVKGEVKLILDNVSISNSSGPAISCVSGDDLVIELIGNNVVKDDTDYASDLDEDITGAIYSKSDLTFEGDGSLTVKASYQDGIVGKDDVKFTSGTYTISAADDGIRGKDSVHIVDGTFDITAQQDGIKSTNDTDAGKGFVLVESGKIHISAGDDGIHGEHSLAIQSGTIDIAKSYEGIESPKIIINGGDISIVAADDGINAGSSSSTTSATSTRGAFDVDESCEITINGGIIHINSSGDGVDSNGWVYFNGGSVTVDGPSNNGNGALDSGAGIVMTGGTVVAIGSSGMAESISTTSSIPSLSVYFTGTYSTGTQLTVKDSSGATIVSHTSAKTFSHATIGSADFSIGSSYTIYINGEKYQTFTIKDIVTTIGNANTISPPGQK